MDLDNEENKDVRIAFNFYRFFGATIPSADMVERWMSSNEEAIEDLQYKDKICLPSLRIESKLLFQHGKEKSKPQKCREGYVTMDWTSNETFVASMKQCIKLLATKKEEYQRNKQGGRNDEDEFTEDEDELTEDEEEAKEQRNDDESKTEDEESDTDEQEEKQESGSRTNRGKGRKKGKGGKRGKRGKRRNFNQFLETAEPEYDPEHIPAPMTKRRSSYIPSEETIMMNEEDDASEVCAYLYIYMFH